MIKNIIFRIFLISIPVLSVVIAGILFVPKADATMTACTYHVFSSSGIGCPSCPSTPPSSSCPTSSGWRCDSTFVRERFSWSWSLSSSFCNSAEGFRRCNYTASAHSRTGDYCNNNDCDANWQFDGGRRCINSNSWDYTCDQYVCSSGSCVLNRSNVNQCSPHYCASNVCYDVNTYRDYYCSSGSCTSKLVNCPSGQTCSGGGCVNRYKCSNYSCVLSVGGSYSSSTCGGDCDPPPPPSCTCGSWTNAACGGGSCPSDQRQQTRSCSPAGCSAESRCIDDVACVTPPPPPPSAPTVTTNAPTGMTLNTANLNGTVNPNGSTATAWFRISAPNANPGSCNDNTTWGGQPSIRVPASGGTSIPSTASYTQPIGGLSPGTSYFYCAIASNTGGTAYGAIVSFTTAYPPPIVTTEPPNSVTSTSATLNGTVDPNGFPTTAWFRYSSSNPGTCNNLFGTRLPSTGGANIGTGYNTIPYDFSATGLTVGITYYYCAIASNQASGVANGFGSVLTFVAANPIIFLFFDAAPTNPVPDGQISTLTADIDYNGDSTDTINYTFWWNCANITTSVAAATVACGDPTDINFGFKTNGVLADPYIITHLYAVGTYTAKVIVERDSASPVQDTATIIVQALADLIPGGGSLNPFPANPGDVVDFSGGAENQGSANAGAFQIRLRVDVDNNGSWDLNPANQVVGSLLIGAAIGVTWNDIWTATAGIHAMEICVDPLNSVAEKDETNNCLTQTFTVGFCIDSCVPLGSNQCYSIRTYQDCGEYDAVNGTAIDTCFEWGPENPDITPPDTPCPPRNTCVAGLCVPAPDWVEVAPQRVQ